MVASVHIVQLRHKSPKNVCPLNAHNEHLQKYTFFFKCPFVPLYGLQSMRIFIPSLSRIYVNNMFGSQLSECYTCISITDMDVKWT